MTRILLIRHGKAASNWTHYDELSDIGKAQSAQLGARLFLDDERPAALFHGTLNRQRVTGEVVRDTMKGRGAEMPPLTVLPALNEMTQDVVNVARQRVPPGERRDSIEAWATGKAAGTDDTRRFMMESYFAYGKGDIVGDFESYLAFRDRVVSVAA